MYIKVNAAQLQYNTIQYNTSFTHASARGTMGRGTTREPILPIVPRALCFPFPQPPCQKSLRRKGKGD